MTVRWLGIVVTGGSLTLVGIDCSSINLTIFADDNWSIQKGDHPVAYRVIFERVKSYVAEQKVDKVVIKASAAGTSCTLSHLHSAELRGVVQVAASLGGAEVLTPAQSAISRRAGKRKVDEYLKDESYWAGLPLIGSLRKGSRTAALMVIAQAGL